MAESHFLRFDTTQQRPAASATKQDLTVVGPGGRPKTSASSNTIPQVPKTAVVQVGNASKVTAQGTPTAVPMDLKALADKAAGAAKAAVQAIKIRSAALTANIAYVNRMEAFGHEDGGKLRQAAMLLSDMPGQAGVQINAYIASAKSV